MSRVISIVKVEGKKGEDFTPNIVKKEPYEIRFTSMCFAAIPAVLPDWEVERLAEAPDMKTFKTKEECVDFCNLQYSEKEPGQYVDYTIMDHFGNVYTENGEYIIYRFESYSPNSRPNNKNAQVGDEAMTAMISFRCTPNVKNGAVKAAQRKGMKLQQWLTKLIEDNV